MQNSTSFLYNWLRFTFFHTENAHFWCWHDNSERFSDIFASNLSLKTLEPQGHTQFYWNNFPKKTNFSERNKSFIFRNDKPLRFINPFPVKIFVIVIEFHILRKNWLPSRFSIAIIKQPPIPLAYYFDLLISILQNCSDFDWIVFFFVASRGELVPVRFAGTSVWFWRPNPFFEKNAWRFVRKIKEFLERGATKRAERHKCLADL